MRRRIVAITVLVAVLSMGLFAVPLGIGAYVYYWTHERDGVQRIAFGIAAAAPDNISAGTQLTELEHPGADDRVGLYDASGRLVSGHGEQDSAGVALVRGALAGRVSRGSVDGRLAVAVPVSDTGAVTGAVLATAPTHRGRALALIWSVLLLVALLVLTITLRIARRLATRLAQPIESLSADAAQLGDARFSLPRPRSGIAEIDSLARSLEAASARVNLLLERERSLAADASHQLRTPLTRLSLTLDAANAADDPTAALRDAQAIVAQLDETMTDMLRLLREDGPGETVDIAALLDHAAARWSMSNADPGRDLRLELDRDLPRGVISAHAARQILDVLVDNAAVHGRGTVTVRARDAGSALAVDVRQEGGSLSPATPDLFAGDRSRGTGLGLALARTIARSEGARLVLTSRDPVTFTVLMPAAVDGANTHSTGGQSPAARAPAADIAGRT